MKQDEFERKEQELVKKMFDHINKAESLCLSLSSRGEHYHNGLMIVGRAVNGWESTKITNDTDFSSLYRNAVSSFRKSPDNLSWVKEAWKRTKEVNGKKCYNSAKSPFWRVVYSLAEKEFSSIIWTNLYKISPLKAGNPTKSMRDAQREFCIELLKVEIDYYKPKTIVFITDDWAKPFSKCFELESMEVGKTYYYNNSQVIIAERPEGKKEKIWIDGVKKLMVNRPHLSRQTLH